MKRIRVPESLLQFTKGSTFHLQLQKAEKEKDRITDSPHPLSVPVEGSQQPSEARVHKIPVLQPPPTFHTQTGMLEWIFPSYPGTIHLLKYKVKAVSIIPFFSGVTVSVVQRRSNF